MREFFALHYFEWVIYSYFVKVSSKYTIFRNIYYGISNP